MGKSSSLHNLTHSPLLPVLDVNIAKQCKLGGAHSSNMNLFPQWLILVLYLWRPIVTLPCLCS